MRSDQAGAERPPTDSIIPQLIDIETLSIQLGDSIRHLRRLIAEDRIPYIKVGHFNRFDPVQIKRWLDDHAHEVSA
jgi:hypothetical protein